MSSALDKNVSGPITYRGIVNSAKDACYARGAPFFFGGVATLGALYYF